MTWILILQDLHPARIKGNQSSMIGGCMNNLVDVTADIVDGMVFERNLGTREC